jgi:hypothetical protein
MTTWSSYITTGEGGALQVRHCHLPFGSLCDWLSCRWTSERIDHGLSGVPKCSQLANVIHFEIGSGSRKANLENQQMTHYNRMRRITVAWDPPQGIKQLGLLGGTLEGGCLKVYMTRDVTNT